MSYPASNYAPPQYPQVDPKSRLNGPAVGMIVAAILAMLSSFAAAGYGVFIYAMVDQVPEMIERERERNGNRMTAEDLENAAKAEEIIDTFGKGYAIFIIVVAVLSLICSVVILFGAVQMMKAKMYGLSMVAAILCLLPTSGCWLISLPMGIWGLVVLMDAHVKRAFR